MLGNGIELKEQAISDRKIDLANYNELIRAVRKILGVSFSQDFEVRHGSNEILVSIADSDTTPPWDFYPRLVAGKWVETNIGTMRIGGQNVEIAALSYTATPRTALELTGSVEWVYASVDRSTTYTVGSIKHSSTEPVSTSSESVLVIAKFTALSAGNYEMTRICLTDKQSDLPTR